VQVLAKKFGAALVAPEHRYYGKSSPFKQLTTENLRFLSSKQALFDLTVFRQYYQVGQTISLPDTVRAVSCPAIESFNFSSCCCRNH
jgi:hypothetical protein